MIKEAAAITAITSITVFGIYLATPARAETDEPDYGPFTCLTFGLNPTQQGFDAISDSIMAHGYTPGETGHIMAQGMLQNCPQEVDTALAVIKNTDHRFVLVGEVK